jgi:NAD-dependent protein deacetylase/lipoamidase
MDDEKTIEEAARLISGSRRLVAFSGAGVSEESGIPTFRDPGGLWDRYDPSDIGGDIFADAFSGSPVPDATFQFVSEFISCFEKTGPNPGHEALGRLEEMGILRSVITQNIDNLHRQAGNSKVIEVHGNVYRLACLSCGNKILLDRDEFLSAAHDLIEFLRKNDVEGLLKLASRCPCGGVCRLDVVNFGEPVQDLPKAVLEARSCDLMLILGTSGVVWPAATLPGHAKKAGAKLVEINASTCCFPDLIDVGIIGKTGETLPRIVELVQGMR